MAADQVADPILPWRVRSWASMKRAMELNCSERAVLSRVLLSSFVLKRVEVVH